MGLKYFFWVLFSVLGGWTVKNYKHWLKTCRVSGFRVFLPIQKIMFLFSNSVSREWWRRSVGSTAVGQVDCWEAAGWKRGIPWLLSSCLYLLTLFYAPILTVMNFGNSQWEKLTGKRIGFCAWWDLNPVYDIGFNKSLLVANMLVCSYCGEQKVNLQLCQAGEKEGEAELQEMVSSCPNVDAVPCCELLYL